MGTLGHSLDTILTINHEKKKNSKAVTSSARDLINKSIAHNRPYSHGGYFPLISRSG